MSYSRRTNRDQRSAGLFRSRSLLALISSITLVSVLVTTGAASAESSPQAPIALAGSSSGVSLDGAEFYVELWPRDDVERALTPGDAVPTFSLPQNVVSVSDRVLKSGSIQTMFLPSMYTMTDGST